MPAIVTPTSIEIAEVGPIANWRDEPNQRVEQATDQIAIDAVLRFPPSKPASDTGMP